MTTKAEDTAIQIFNDRLADHESEMAKLKARLLADLDAMRTAHVGVPSTEALFSHADAVWSGVIDARSFGVFPGAAAVLSVTLDRVYQLELPGVERMAPRLGGKRYRLIAFAYELKGDGSTFDPPICNR